MRLRVGTSGFSYKEWKGSFYPEDLKKDDWLRFYGEQFSSVEINNTFYRMPKDEVLERWAADVPEQFQFVIKASRQITHFKRLKEESKDSLEYLLERCAALGPKLGPLLFQLPPNFKQDLARLEAFLEFLPAGVRAAFEFRHPSWFETDEALELLRAKNAALVTADVGPLAESGDEVPIQATADWGYLRLRRVEYQENILQEWVTRIAQQPWKETFLFFKHEDEGTGPRLAKRFDELFGAV